MTTATELAELFDFHPATPRIVGFGSNAGLMRERDSQATAVAVTAELLHPKDKKPSGKWLLLQLQPADALILVAAILVHAQEQGWPIPENLIERIEHVRFPAKDEKKH
jgi:hypothetical protein